MGKMALSHGIPGLDRRSKKDICHHPALQRHSQIPSGRTGNPPTHEGKPT
jgi:hypothetical protein